MTRCRVREALPGIYLGRFKPGSKNSITDIKGVLVSTKEIRTPNTEKKHAVNTGITTILARKDFFNEACFAGIFRFNGSGECTGSHWLEETGLLQSPIVITNSFATGAGIQGVLEWIVREEKDEKGLVDFFQIPVITETCDLYLSDIGSFPITSAMVVEGIDEAIQDGEGAVKEGNTGGGCGMICSWWKGGTGSSSRLIPGRKRSDPVDGQPGKLTDCEYTVAALVQANYGRKADFRFGGVPIGRYMAEDEIAEKEAKAVSDEKDKNQEDLEKSKAIKDGSIIIVIATDAPLSPLQLTRLAKRGTVGLARAGGMGHNTSGDIFLAFSTAAKIPALGSKNAATDPWTLTPLPYGDCESGIGAGQCDDYTINALFEATSDVVEESIYNAVCMAETMVGPLGRTVEAIDLKRLRELWDQNKPSR